MMTLMKILVMAGAAFLPAALGQEVPAKIELKLVNPWSGKPLAGLPIILFKDTSGISAPKRQIVPPFPIKTGPDGTAHFTLESPFPENVSFYLGATTGCPHKGDPPIQSEFNLKEIVSSGMVLPDTCVPKNWSGKFRWQDVVAKPGQIIFFSPPPPRLQW